MRSFVYKLFFGILIVLCACGAFGRGLAHMHTVNDFIGIVCIIICAIFTFVLGIYMLFDAYQTHKDKIDELLQEE